MEFVADLADFIDKLKIIIFYLQLSPEHLNEYPLSIIIMYK